MVNRKSCPLWYRDKIQIEYVNMVGKIETGIGFDLDRLISRGAVYDIRANGARFEVGKVSVKVFQGGTMIAYGAHSRKSIWKAFRGAFTALGISGSRKDMAVFLVVSKTWLPFTIGKKAMPAIMERLSRDYVTGYDPDMPFPGIWLSRGDDTVKRIMARVYASGVITCEARTEEIVKGATLDIYGKVCDVKDGLNKDCF